MRLECSSQCCKITRHHASPPLVNVCHHSSHHHQRKTMDDVILYMQGPTPNVNTNPLQWWQLNESRYPRLLNLALNYLGTPATSTSTPCERVFSEAGEIVSGLRVNLKPSMHCEHFGVLIKKSASCRPVMNDRNVSTAECSKRNVDKMFFCVVRAHATDRSSLPVT